MLVVEPEMQEGKRFFLGLFSNDTIVKDILTHRHRGQIFIPATPGIWLFHYVNAPFYLLVEHGADEHYARVVCLLVVDVKGVRTSWGGYYVGVGSFPNPGNNGDAWSGHTSTRGADRAPATLEEEESAIPGNLSHALSNAVISKGAPTDW